MREARRGKLGIFLEHWYTTLAVLFAVGYGVMCAASLSAESWQFARWATGLGLLAGNGMLAIGYLRMMPPGPKVQALLVTACLQGLLWLPPGFMYLWLAVSSEKAGPVVATIWGFYLVFGAAAGGDILLGLYAMVFPNRFKRALVSKVPWRW